MSDQMIGEEYLPVKIMNPEVLENLVLPVPVQEHEPEHFICQTFVLANTQNPPYANIYLDPMRKSVTILPIDSPVVVCHSQADAQKPDNQVASVPNPQGAYVPTGTPLSLEGSGPLWIVATVATASRVSVVQARRGSA
jgi:hypothetical protein